MPDGVRLAGVLERLHRRLPAALEENLDLLLCRLETRLTVPGERHSALERPQRLIEWHITALEPLDQTLELDQRLFKINGFVIA